MIPVNPTVTWPNHTSMVTGVRPERHTVLYNGWAVRGAEGERLRTEAHVPKTELVKGTTVYDLAHQAGLTTAEVDWVAIENAPTITYAFTEYSNPEGAIEKEMIAAGVMTAEELVAFKKAPITFRDEIWTRAGEHIIKTHKPNLLLFHLLTDRLVAASLRRAQPRRRHGAVARGREGRAPRRGVPSGGHSRQDDVRDRVGSRVPHGEAQHPRERDAEGEGPRMDPRG